jgi:hypothetical protein
LIFTTGSSAVPTLTMLPPLGPLIAALAPPIAVTVPNVRLPWYTQLTRCPRFISSCRLSWCLLVSYNRRTSWLSCCCSHSTADHTFP